MTDFPQCHEILDAGSVIAGYVKDKNSIDISEPKIESKLQKLITSISKLMRLTWYFLSFTAYEITFHSNPMEKSLPVLLAPTPPVSLQEGPTN